MAVRFALQYSAEAVKHVVAFYKTLSEKDQRRFAAVEACRLGRGGIKYVASVLDCSRRTIERGIHELDKLPDDPVAGRVRRPGGGRKKSRDRTPVAREFEIGVECSHGRRP